MFVRPCAISGPLCGTLGPPGVHLLADPRGEEGDAHLHPKALGKCPSQQEAAPWMGGAAVKSLDVYLSSFC